MSEFMHIIQERKKRWLNFYDPSRPERLIYMIRYAPGNQLRPLPRPELKRERVEWIWQNYQFHCQRMLWLEDDTLPYLDMLTGTEIFSEAFGCQVYYPDDNYPMAIPLVKNAAEAEKLAIPSLDAPSLALAFSMADELAERAGPGAIFRLVDMQCPIDVAAMIWEKTDFYPTLIQNPEAILSLLEKIKVLQFNFLDEWFRRYGQEFVAHFPDYYVPRGISLSVDEIGAVSSRMFLKYFLPELNDFSRRYGGLGMHCCAASRHQWNFIKEIEGLFLLNIIQPEPVLRDAYPYFSDVAAQWHYGWDPDPTALETWINQIHPMTRLVIDMTAQSEEEAIHLSNRLQEIRSGLASPASGSKGQNQAATV
jgi:hypothetical protein